MAADLSVRLGWVDRSILDRTRALLLAAKLPIAPPPEMTVQQFRDLMAVDKKARSGAGRRRGRGRRGRAAQRRRSSGNAAAAGAPRAGLLVLRAASPPQCRAHQPCTA